MRPGWFSPKISYKSYFQINIPKSHSFGQHTLSTLLTLLKNEHSIQEYTDMLSYITKTIINRHINKSLQASQLKQLADNT